MKGNSATTTNEESTSSSRTSGIVRDVLYIRHSQSVWNDNQDNKGYSSIRNTIMEVGDAPLTDKGIGQSANLGVWINESEGVEISTCLDDSPSCLASRLGWGVEVEQRQQALASGGDEGNGSSAERLCSLERKGIESGVLMEDGETVSADRIREIMKSIDGTNAIIAVSNLRRAIQTLMIALNYKFFFTRPTNWIIKGAHYSYPQ